MCSKFLAYNFFGAINLKFSKSLISQDIIKIKIVEYISRNCMRVQNDLSPIMPATSSQCYAVCSTSCGMYYNLCWELLAKWAINQLQLCLLVQCTFAIQYQMQQINISYFLFSFSYTLIHSWWTIFLGAWPLFIIKLFHRCYNLDTIESLSAQKREQAGKSFDVYSSGSFSNYQNILLFCMYLRR